MPEVGSLTFMEGADEGRIGDWSEVVQGIPTGRWGWITSFLWRKKKTYLTYEDNVCLVLRDHFSQE